MRLHLLLFIIVFFKINLSAQSKDALGDIGFIENKGQVIDQNGNYNDDVKYLLPTKGLNVLLKRNGFSYDVYEMTSGKKVLGKNKVLNTEDIEHNFKYVVHRVDFTFQNVNSDFEIIPEEKSRDYFNYYGLKSETGVEQVYNYRKIVYKNIYNNIDIVFSVPEDKLKPVEYNFVIHPGGKISDIKFSVEGAQSKLQDNNICMKLRFGTLIETIPMSWIEEDSGIKTINVEFNEVKKNLYGFNSDDIANSTKTIVIDPVPIRLWGTYFGGEDFAINSGITSDDNNNIYIGGTTSSSTNIATVGTHQSTFNTDSRGFIVKFNSEGLRLWGTYYAQSPRLIAIDNDYNVIFTGYTQSQKPNTSSSNAFQQSKNAYNDGFLVKLNSAGLREWGTYYGGNGNDYIYAVTIDPSNNIYIGGDTSSTQSVVTTGSYQDTFSGNTAGLLVKFNTQGQRIWGTYYPGSFFSVQISGDGSLYAAGVANTPDGIATPGSYQTTYGGEGDGMIVKFTTDGERIWGTYLGTATMDYVLRGTLHENKYYLSGRTYSTTGIATPDTFLPEYQTTSNPDFENTFIICFDVESQDKTWGTYFFDQITGLDVGSNHEVYFCGDTSFETGITTPNSYMPIKGDYNKSYLIKLNSEGQRIWGTYYGGNKAEQVCDVTIDTAGDIYLYGKTNGSTSGISTLGAHQPELGGSIESTYLAKFKDCMSSSMITGDENICIGEDIILTAQGGDSYLWTGPNNFTFTGPTITIAGATQANSGEYSCQISGTEGCDNTLTINVTVGDNLAPVPDIESLPEIVGTCNVTITTFPTATENCAGSITATTTDNVVYDTAGTYTITWMYTGTNGEIVTQNQTVIVQSSNNIVYDDDVSYNVCSNNNIVDLVTLSEIITEDDAQFSFFATETDAQSNNDAIENSNAFEINTSQSIFVRATLSNGCKVISHLHLNIIDIPVTNAQINKCSVENTITLNLQEEASLLVNPASLYTLSFFSSEENLESNTSINNEDSFVATLGTQTLYVKVTDVNGCYSVSELVINISQITEIELDDFHRCSEGGAGTNFDLQERLDEIFSLLPPNDYAVRYYDSYNDAISGSSNDVSSNYMLTAAQQYIFYRLDSQLECPVIVSVRLSLLPEMTIDMENSYSKCYGQLVTVSAGNNFDTYSWSNGAITPEITVNSTGNYWVTVTREINQTVCQKTHYFTVVNNLQAEILEIEISEWSPANNSITVYSSSPDEVEYSINGIDFQNSNQFSNLTAGYYTVFVRNACGTVTKKVSILDYPKFFTPNGDGINDLWTIKYINPGQDVFVTIFDRYGKVIHSFNGSTSGWDGTYNGKSLPATDYWFVVKKDNTEFKNHFSLIR